MTDSVWPPVRRRVVAALRQPMILAVTVAALVTLGLAIAVLTAWSAGADDDPSARLGSIATETTAPEGGPTPTPRVIATRSAATAAAATAAPAAAPTLPPDPEPTAPAAAVEPTSTAAITAASTTAPTADGPRIVAVDESTIAPAAETVAPEPTATPRPTAPPKPAPTAPPEALFVAEKNDLAALAAGSWLADAGGLRNDAVTVVAEPWLVFPHRPDGEAYALEAEIKVAGAIEGRCNQNFGLVAGAANGPAPGAPLFGGGIIYSCTAGNLAGGPTLARLSDLATWNSGYFQLASLARKEFAPTPADGWHVYRLEVDGADVRLLVDGKEVATTQGAAASLSGPSQVGLWSQGVRLAVRRVAVLPVDG